MKIFLLFTLLISHAHAYKNKLILAKLAIIQGNLPLAIKTLNDLENQQDINFELVRKRLLLLAYSIKADYNNLVELITQPYWYSTRKCEIIGTILFDLIQNQSNLDNIKHLFDKSNLCIELTLNKSPTKNFWPQLILSNKYNNKVFFLEEYIKKTNNIKFHEYFTHLKGLILFNKTFDINDYVLEIPSHFIAKKSIKEIIAYGHFKNNNTVFAKKYIKNLNTLNSYIMQGIILLETKDYSMAHKQFSKAYNIKKTSPTTIRSLFPLNILLEKWDKAIFNLNESKMYDKQHLLSAYLFLKTNKPQEAVNLLTKYKYNKLNKNNLYEELLIVGLILTQDIQNVIKAKSLLTKDCQNTDFNRHEFSCTLLKALYIWPDMPKLFTSKEKVFNDLSWDPRQEKEQIKENITINQNLIEELEEENDILEY